MELRYSLIFRRLVFIGCCIFAVSLPLNFSLRLVNIHIPLIKSLLALEMIFLLFLWEVFIIFERKLIVKFTSLALPMGVFLLLHLYSSVFPS